MEVQTIEELEGLKIAASLLEDIDPNFIIIEIEAMLLSLNMIKGGLIFEHERSELRGLVRELELDRLSCHTALYSFH